MLTVVTYATKRELDERLKELVPAGSPLRFIAPFPAKADALRARFGDRPHTDVGTFSRFTQDFFALLPGEHGEPWRKSRLLLQLNAFRHLIPGLAQADFGLFKTAYQVFSDLRAYTDAPDLPDELLAPFDERVAMMAQLFHQGTRAAGVLDEHGAVFELTAALRAPEAPTLPGAPALVFDGFTFLTPAQLSLLEALAIRHQVYVPLPESVLAQCHALDWPKALELSAHQVLRSHAVALPRVSLAYTQHPRAGLAAALRTWRAQQSGEVHVVLAGKDLDESHLQEIPFSDAFMKWPLDVTLDAREAVFSRWEKRLSSAGKPLPGGVILDWIQQDIQRVVESRDLALMRELAVLKLVQAALKAVPGALERQPLDAFLMLLLREVIALDAPRASLIPLMREESLLGVYSLKTIHALPASGAVAVCLDAALGPIKSDHRPFSPEMEKTLAKLGPVRRPELEFLFLTAELTELWTRPGVTLLIEHELLKHDLGWKRLLEGVPLELRQLNAQPALAPAGYGFFQVPEAHVPPVEKLSASRLQDFLDCPRRYHASRLARIIPDAEATLELEPMVLGRIEHALVEAAWNKGAQWWARPGALEEAATQMVAMQDQAQRLTPAVRMAASSEAALYARNGLLRLSALQRAMPGMELRFEVKITAEGRSGSIDCLGMTEESVVLLDFKRSKGQNPSFNAWEQDYPKVQLWFYLQALREEGVLSSDKKIAVGYLFFKDLDESWLASDPALFAAVEREAPGWAREWDDASPALDRYAQFEAEQRQRLMNERVFAPTPRVSGVCDNCALRPVCPRGADEGGDE